MTAALTRASEIPAAAVAELAASCQAHDAVAPLNEQANIELARGVELIQLGYFLADQLIGYAQLDPTDRSVQLLIHPSQRGLGYGEKLAREVQQNYQPSFFWAFGTHPAAEKIAAKLGLAPVRKLGFFTRDAQAPVPKYELPKSYVLRSFVPTDLPALLEVNALAFAHHPEQGQLSAEDFADRASQPWFNPRDLLLAIDSQGKIAGFHWMKITEEPELTGEVYVIGVRPDLNGIGLGRALLFAGLAQLQLKGVQRIVLYADADEQRVIKIYCKAGFELAKLDTAYAAVERQIARHD